MSRTLSSGTTDKVHDTSACILERALQQANCNIESHTGTAQRTLVVRNGPGIMLQLLEDVGDLELGLLDREEESRRRGKRRAGGLLLRDTRANAMAEAQHFLNLLGGVILVATEDVRFGAFGVAKLVNLDL